MSNKSPEKISRAFDDCHQMIDKENAQLEDCLIKHPQHKHELTMLLDLTNVLKTLKNVNPSERFSKNAVERITQALVDRPVTFCEVVRFIFTKKPYRSKRKFSMAQVLVTFILLIALATGGVFAADAAQPGDVLYGFDRAFDQVKVMFISDPEIVVSTRLTYAAERLEEAKNKIEYGELDKALIAFEAYDHEIDQIARLVANADGLYYDNLAALLSEAFYIHKETLEHVFTLVPDEAREAILNAIHVSLQNVVLPLNPPTDTVPVLPVEIPPAPPVDIPIVPPEDTLPPLEEILPSPPVIPPQGPPEDLPPIPPLETPETPINDMP